MKVLLKLCLCLGFFALATPLFAQVPDPGSIDECSCLPGVQYASDPCPCDPGSNNGSGNTGNGNTNTGNTNTGNTGTGGPTATGNGPGGFPEGAFPLVIQWLDCFYDPDCDP